MRRTIVAVVALLAVNCLAQEMKSVELPKPVTTGGKPLMECLKDRHSTRDFSSEALPLQTLSNLLWAAWGVNREDGRRTAPSAMNQQEIEVYVVLADGVYLYDAGKNLLKPVASGDHRAATGGQDFVGVAPLNLVYVADTDRMGKMGPEDKTLYSAADVGFIAQNVYLYSASEGLACVVRGSINRQELSKLMKLDSNRKIVLAQTVGKPAK